MSWLTKEPYFVRVDLHRARGLVPAPVAPPLDPQREIDRSSIEGPR